MSFKTTCLRHEINSIGINSFWCELIVYKTQKEDNGELVSCTPNFNDRKLTKNVLNNISNWSTASNYFEMVDDQHILNSFVYLKSN